jgi:two-component system, sensor histidine kinase and response regulator
VDDNATNLHILDRMLSNWGLKTTLAHSGSAALGALKSAAEGGHPFLLVVLDAHMPDVDGFALAKQIKQDPRLSGAILTLLSSAGQRGDAARCRELGISAYLTKPVGEAELLDAIRRALLPAITEAEAPPALVTRHVVQEEKRCLRFLVVDDNPVNRLWLTRLVEKQGHLASVAENGREALTLLEKQQFDCALMDVQMPIMDGFEVTGAIREKERISRDHLPIVALTAHTMLGDRERCLAAGMDEYVPKPVSPKDLFTTIERVLPLSVQTRAVGNTPATLV